MLTNSVNSSNLCASDKTKITTFAIPKTSKAPNAKTAKTANANAKTENNAETPSFSWASIAGNNAHMGNADKG